MRRTNLVLGLLLLLVAAAVAVYTADPSAKQGLPSGAASPDPRAERSVPRRGDRPTRTPTLRQPAPARNPAAEYLPVIETLAVEPLGDSHPALDARARRVQAGSIVRLEELIAGLGLTETQQLEIFPLLARSHPDYNHQLHLVGVPATSALEPLGKFAADRLIHKVLDPDQQLELEIMAASADVWWTDVIARLEKDLNESTRRTVPADEAPEHDPSPSREDPSPPPAAPAPSNPRGNNLFDLLQDDQS